ncbi:MAG: hypothetical protein PWR01_4571 [Clostridiales bacterium]|nr:hypothetical protein [Clostridiales bacterium]MDN5283498.1 hypothetical protein [Candidatus Ozemobacter sp.]
MKKSNSRILFVLLSMFFAASSLFALSIPGGLIRETNLTPGAESSGKIMLVNPSDKALTIKIFKTDYLHYADGRKIFADPGENKFSNLEWITFFPNQITIPAKQTGYVDYRIQVPEKSDLSGTYWSVLMIEPVPPTSPSLPENKGKPQLGVQTIIRYALQIITNFEKDSDKALKFIEKQLVIKKDGKFFRIDLENTGNRLVKTSVWMEIYDSKGISLGRFTAADKRIFPACSERFDVDLSQLPGGDYTALLIADIGNDKVFGAKYKLKIP